MSALSATADAFGGIVKILKKGAAHALVAVFTFLNTLLGKCTAVAVLVCVIAAAAYYADVVLVPMLVSAFGALWRRIVFYVAVRRLSARRRRWLRTQWSTACSAAQRKWGSLLFWERLALKFVAGVIVGMSLLHYLHIWSVAVYITAILPIPVFLEVYLGQKLPRIIVGFIQRQGVGKLVFDGGWRLVPQDWRSGARDFDRTMTFVIKRADRKSVDRVLERLERIRELRRKRAAEQKDESLRLERDLAALG
jgi:hypothetical protein